MVITIAYYILGSLLINVSIKTCLVASRAVADNFSATVRANSIQTNAVYICIPAPFDIALSDKFAAFWLKTVFVGIIAHALRWYVTPFTHTRSLWITFIFTLHTTSNRQISSRKA